MSTAIEIFSKVLLYSIIIIVVRKTLNKIRKPIERTQHLESEEIVIDRKAFSNIYLAVAIGFTILIIFILSISSPFEEKSSLIAMCCFVVIDLFCYLMSFLYGRVYIKFGDEKISWGRMNGKEIEFKYEDITSYKMDGNGDLRLYQNNQCVLGFATFENKELIREVLKHHKVKDNMNSNSPKIIMKMGKGYVAFDGFCIAASVIFLIGCVYYFLIFGVLFFFIFTIASIISFFYRKSIEIIVENNTITEKKMWRKDKMIKFGEVAYLKLLEGNNTGIICVCSQSGTSIKIPEYYQNVGDFELIIKKQHWKWK